MGLVYSRADGPPVGEFKGLSPAANALFKDLKKDISSRPGVDYTNLPPPVKYEDMSREIMFGLKPDVFEGFKFDLTKPLNQNFFLTHSLFMGNMDLPSQRGPLKCPMGTYEFGANVISDKFFLIGRITADGRLSGRVKYDVMDWLSVKGQVQMSGEPGPAGAQYMVDADIKGKDWNSQLKLGAGNFYGLNYFQSVTPKLALGAELFWLQSNLKSGVGLAARHADEKHIAVAQVATTGILSLQYGHKVTDKIMLLTDLMYNWLHREASASVGYDVTLRQCRVRGNINTAGIIQALLEERFIPGITFLLSAELDHSDKNYKFGFGFSVGD